MRRVRFAPSPTGSLHVGNALSAVANRGFGDWFLLRIDDTDPQRNVPGGQEAILRDLEWLGLEWDEGPVRQSERAERYAEAAAHLGDRFGGITLVREDGSATYHRATVAALRGEGIPATAVRRYLDELGLPKHDVHYDLPRIRRLAIEAIAELPDEELAAVTGAPLE